MESNRTVVPLELVTVGYGVVLKPELKNSCGRDQHMAYSRWAAVIAGLFLLLLSFFYNALPASANVPRPFSSAGLRVDSLGGHRGSLDLNRVLRKGVLAVRGLRQPADAG